MSAGEGAPTGGGGGGATNGAPKAASVEGAGQALRAETGAHPTAEQPADRSGNPLNAAAASKEADQAAHAGGGVVDTAGQKADVPNPPGAINEILQNDRPPVDANAIPLVAEAPEVQASTEGVGSGASEVGVAAQSGEGRQSSPEELRRQDVRDVLESGKFSEGATREEAGASDGSTGIEAGLPVASENERAATTARTPLEGIEPEQGGAVTEDPRQAAIFEKLRTGEISVEEAERQANELNKGAVEPEREAAHLATEAAAGGPVTPGEVLPVSGLPVEVAPAPTKPVEVAPVAAPQPAEQPPASGTTPPLRQNAPTVPSTSNVSSEVQAKIDAITNSDNSPNAERAARQQEHKAAEQKMTELEAKKASGPLSPDDQKTFDAAKKTVDRIQRDANFEVRADQVKAMSDEDVKIEEQTKLAKEQVAAWKQDTLGADSAYQRAKEVVDKAPKDWEALGEAPKGQEAAYKEYVDARKTVRRAEQAAEINARERQIAQDITLSPDARNAKVAKLEKDRRAARKNDFLEENAKYQKLQGYAAATEKALRDDEIGLTDEDLRALGKDGIAGIKDDEKRAKVNQYAKAHAKEFRDYLINRQAMNEQESVADIAAAHERYDKGFRDDGSKMEGTDKEIAEQKKDAKQKKNKDFDPAKGLLWPRRVWYGLNKKIDWFMGREEMKKSGKQFTDNIKLLVGRYGLKGLIPFGIGTGKDAKDIRAHQLEALKGAAGWVRRGIPRLARLFLFLMAGYWLITPIIAGKVLEMTKPFGGGQ